MKRVPPLRWACAAAEVAGAVLLAAVVVIVLIQVVTRYVLHIAVSWPEELARYILVWMMFLGAAVAEARHQQVSVDTLSSLSSPRVRLGMHLVAAVAGLVSIGLLLHTSRPLFGPVGLSASPATGIELRWIYLALPVGATLLGLFLVDDLRQLLRGRLPEEPAPHDDLFG